MAALLEVRGLSAATIARAVEGQARLISAEPPTGIAALIPVVCLKSFEGIPVVMEMPSWRVKHRDQGKSPYTDRL